MNQIESRKSSISRQKFNFCSHNFFFFSFLFPLPFDYCLIYVRNAKERLFCRIGRNYVAVQGKDPNSRL